jgi:hypothetical protein
VDGTEDVLEATGRHVVDGDRTATYAGRHRHEDGTDDVLDASGTRIVDGHRPVRYTARHSREDGTDDVQDASDTRTSTDTDRRRTRAFTGPKMERRTPGVHCGTRIVNGSQPAK